MRGAFLHPCCYATKQFLVFLDKGFGIFVFTRKVFPREFKVKADKKDRGREENYFISTLLYIHGIPTVQTLLSLKK